MIKIIEKENNVLNMDYTIKSDDKNILQILKNRFGFSSNYIKYLKNNNLILLNNIPVYITHPIEHNNCLTIILPNDEESENIVPLDYNLDILYKDKFLIIVNKPSNMPIHPSMNHYGDSLSNALKNYYLKHNYNFKIRPINRLDKDTSGIVLFAKYPFIQEQLSIQMKNNTFIKKYMAFVEGIFEPQSGIINLPIVRKNNSIIERTVDINDKTQKSQASTIYKTIKCFDGYSQVEFQLISGKTHQIRVHSSHLGHPLIGDTLYGKPSDLISRQALHCYLVEFIHPITKQRIRITSKLPKDMSWNSKKDRD